MREALRIFCIFLSGVVASMQFAKITTLVPIISVHFDLSNSEIGILSSAIGFVGLILGIPFAGIVSHLGAKNSLLFGLLAAFLMSTLQTFTDNFSVFLASRFVEGIAHIFLVVSAPILMIKYSTERSAPFAMALWGTFFGVGYILTGVIAAAITKHMDFHYLFLFHGAFAFVLCVILWLTLTREKRGINLQVADIIAQYRKVCKNGKILIQSLVFTAHTLMFVSFYTYLPNFLVLLGYDQGKMPVFISLFSLITIVSTMASSILSVKLSRRNRAFYLSFSMVVVGTAAMSVLKVNAIICGLFLFAGLGLTQGLVFLLVPLLFSKREDISLASGSLTSFGNLGSFAGPPIAGFFIDTLAFDGFLFFIVLSCSLGLLMSFLLDRKLEPDPFARHPE